MGVRLDDADPGNGVHRKPPNTTLMTLVHQPAPALGSADFQSAVSPSCTRHAAGKLKCADLAHAMQIPNLRYPKGPPRGLGDDGDAFDWWWWRHLMQTAAKRLQKSARCAKAGS